MNVKKTYPNLLIADYNYYQKRKKGGQIKILEIEHPDFYIYWGEVNFGECPRIDEKKLHIEDQYCEKFGCGEKLSMLEKLCGGKCTKHAETKNDGQEYR